ncbi:MAG: HlyD family efflux transporter periplasmic adaptor subunit [Clostridia bacterium]|nr:HlyD family efflux transporter periplasmic adaptor subunit [Clostridia bacterium]
MKKVFAVCLALIMCLLPACAAGKGVYISGTVVNTNPIQLVAAFGGRVESVSAFAGDYVNEGDELMSLSGTKVYAQQDGTAHLFAEAGDSAEAVTEAFGAVAYIEAASPLSISASTQYAYESEETKLIHPGERVYVRSINYINHVGMGYVTSVSGTSYTVLLTEGNFTAKEAVYIYRDASYAYNSRIGRGTAARQDPVAYTAEGVISKVYVEDGAEVKKGDALFETLSGAYAGSNSAPGKLVSPADGVVYSSELARGASVAEGDPVAVLYPDEFLRIEAGVTEADLEYFPAGTKVTIELVNYGDGKTVLGGTVEKVSHAGSAGAADSDGVTYSVLIKPEGAERLYYGMIALVSPAD